MSGAPFEPAQADWRAVVEETLSRQRFMAFLGVEAGALEPGRVELRLAWRRALAQNHGYFHGGVIATLASEDALCLTAEFKINFVAPGRGELLVARGEVIKPGRRLTVARAEVFAVADGVERMCATALVTLVMTRGED